jgi:hypothetical protein
MDQPTSIATRKSSSAFRTIDTPNVSKRRQRAHIYIGARNAPRRPRRIHNTEEYLVEDRKNRDGQRSQTPSRRHIAMGFVARNSQQGSRHV